MTSPSTTRAPTSIFYGWWMVATAFLCQGVTAGCTMYIFGIFLKPVAEEFGATRGTLSLGIMIFPAAGGLIAPFLGSPLDRGKIRGVMALGLVALSAGLVLSAWAPSLWVLGLVIATLLAFASNAAGPLSASKLVANWFEGLRGRALGIASTGTSAGGAVFPLLIALGIGAWGWRGALLALGIGVAAVTLPPVLLLVRSRPEDLGLTPDGKAPAPSLGETAPAGVTAQPSIGVREILRDRNFWALGLAVGLSFAVLTVVLINLHAYATDAGVDGTAAALLLTILAISGICGKLAFGFLADRVSKRLLMGVAIVMLGSFLFVLLAHPSYGVLAATAGLAGLAVGGFLPLWGALIGDCWGREAFARVMALMAPLMTPLNMAGMAYPGLIHDRTGSYDAAWQISVGLLGLAALCLAFLRPPQRA
ncbi:MAG: MFS transporter [Myxococcota bacterium]|jgi:MFS family permease|nr:MFS transporter [bacterium]MDP6074201.1 MFS transporter [Myxococcota bacterium]MDP6243065.1 MFS transporter [Myxococcota bacterium]MDP7075797.1 MFS transporter [Myxococcota bacterium]MDP7298547.1 MFS transporter [Myxococcota bacterium]